MARPLVTDPSTWIPYPGSCEGCWAGCCHLPVDADLADLERLEVLRPGEAALPLVQVFLRLKARGVVAALQRSTGRFVLAQGAAGRCLYLGPDGRCTVYERRPRTCRAFPEVNVRPGHCPAAPLEEG